MFTVTESAQNQLNLYFNDNEKKPVRVLLHGGGCGGPQVVLALDERKDGDLVHEIGGVQYLTAEDFFEEAKPITLDFRGQGFTVLSSLRLGGGCGGSCSSGGCGA